MVGKEMRLFRQKRSFDGACLTWRLVIGYHLVEAEALFL